MIRKLNPQTETNIVDQISTKIFHNKSFYRYAFFHHDHINQFISDIGSEDGYTTTYLSYDSSDESKLLGVIAFCIDQSSDSVHALVILSLKESKLTFGRDIYRAFQDMALNENTYKFVFSSSENNPLLSQYRTLIKKYGGREVGVLRNNILDKLFSEKRYDEIIFEIEASEIKKHIKGEQLCLAVDVKNEKRTSK